jgi:transposase
MRFIGLDVHRDFCEVAIAEAGRVRLAGRVKTEPEALALFAQSLAVEDEVALEATGNALGIARVIEPHVGRVVLANPKAVKGIIQAGAKTDKIDARTLAKLLAGGFLPEVWLPDEQTRILRRRVSHRAQLVRQHTRAKNQVHATLIRNLKGKPPVSDLFGVRGRRWLAEQVLPADEQETVAACLRQIAFLDAEIALVECALARQVLASREMRRLLTLPGVNFVTAAALIAAIGEIDRFATARHLVSYLGFDPRVRQSGTEPARHGRISKQGPGEARHVPVEAAWHAARTTGPLHAFHERIAARRGSNVATVAVARKLAVIAWHMLSHGEDYAFARPRSHARSCAGSSRCSAPSDTRASATQSASSPARSSTGSSVSSPPRPSSPTGGSSRTGSPRSTGARVPHRGAHLVGRQAAKQRGRRQPHLLRFSTRSPAPNPNSRKGAADRPAT